LTFNLIFDTLSNSKNNMEEFDYEKNDKFNFDDCAYRHKVLLFFLKLSQRLHSKRDILIQEAAEQDLSLEVAIAGSLMNQ